MLRSEQSEGSRSQPVQDEFLEDSQHNSFVEEQACCLLRFSFTDRTKLSAGYNHCGWGQHIPLPGQTAEQDPIIQWSFLQEAICGLKQTLHLPKGSEHVAAAQARKWCWVTFSAWGSKHGVRPPALLIPPSREGLPRTSPVALQWDLTGVCHGEKSLLQSLVCRELLLPQSWLQIHSVWKAAPHSTQTLSKMPPASCSSMQLPW